MYFNNSLSKSQVGEMCEEAPDEIKILAKGPMMTARKYSSLVLMGSVFTLNRMMRGNLFKTVGLL